MLTGSTVEQSDTMLYFEKKVVKRISELMDPFKLTRLDYKIQNISMFGSDESIS